MQSRASTSIVIFLGKMAAVINLTPELLSRCLYYVSVKAKNNNKKKPQ